MSSFEIPNINEIRLRQNALVELLGTLGTGTRICRDTTLVWDQHLQYIQHLCQLERQRLSSTHILLDPEDPSIDDDEL